MMAFLVCTGCRCACATWKAVERERALVLLGDRWSAALCHDQKDSATAHQRGTPRRCAQVDALFRLAGAEPFHRAATIRATVERVSRNAACARGRCSIGRQPRAPHVRRAGASDALFDLLVALGQVQAHVRPSSPRASSPAPCRNSPSPLTHAHPSLSSSSPSAGLPAPFAVFGGARLARGPRA